MTPRRGRFPKAPTSIVSSDMRLAISPLALPLLVLPLLACSDSTSPPEPCEGDLSVTAASSDMPRFSWTPRCGISRLVVVDVPDAPGEEERVVWGFEVPELQPIGPGITYGESPSRATVWVEPEMLQVGETYRVDVAHTQGGDVFVASGEALFTWVPPD